MQFNRSKIQQIRKQIMKVNDAVWKGLKKQIEYYTEHDNEITDITINYQVKRSKDKNYLKLTVKQ